MSNTDMQFFDRDGIRLAYRQEGRGPVVVFLHGLGASGESWDHQGRAFRASHRIIRPDFRGFGHSDKPYDRASYSVDIFADDIAALLNHLDAWPATIVATSMGGYMALTLALRFGSEIEKLVLCHTACSRRVPEAVMRERLAALGSSDMYGYARVAVQHAVGQDTSPDIVRRVENMIASNDQGAYTAVFSSGGLDFDVCSRLSEIQCPTWVIGSREDQVVPYARSQELAAGIKGAELIALEKVGHLSYIEQPARFNAVLARILES